MNERNAQAGPSAAGLSRSLGLRHVFVLSTGAMLSSGLFLLPGLAAADAGPSAVLAYALAGVVAVPAMLSVAELSTAMPRAGGAYYFLVRAYGPAVGTFSGMATWLSLVLKDAFALVGMSAYLNIVLDVPAKPLAVVLIAGFTIVNILGTRASAGVQMLLVGFVLAVMGWFIAVGLPRGRQRRRRRRPGAVLRRRDGRVDQRRRAGVRVLRRADQGGQRGRGDQRPVPQHPSGDGPVAAGQHCPVHARGAGGGGGGPAVAAARRPGSDLLRGGGRDAHRGGGAGGSGRAGRVLVGHQRRDPGCGPLPAGNEPRPAGGREAGSAQPVQHPGLGGGGDRRGDGRGGAGPRRGRHRQGGQRLRAADPGSGELGGAGAAGVADRLVRPGLHRSAVPLPAAGRYRHRPVPDRRAGSGGAAADGGVGGAGGGVVRVLRAHPVDARRGHLPRVRALGAAGRPGPGPRAERRGAEPRGAGRRRVPGA